MILRRSLSAVLVPVGLACAASFVGACHSTAKTEIGEKSATEKATVPSAEPQQEARTGNGPTLAYAGDSTAQEARLTVETPDEFAVITVDGETRGTSPRAADNPIRLAAGAHRVELRYLPSGPTKTLSFQVAAGETHNIVEHK